MIQILCHFLIADGGELEAGAFVTGELFQPSFIFQVRPEAYSDGVEDILAFFVWPLFWLLFSKIWLFFQNLAIFSRIWLFFPKFG